MRTLEEVRTCYHNTTQAQDPFGYGREVLGKYLPETWRDGYQYLAVPLSEETIRREATRYLMEVFTKRTWIAIKLREWMWILGQDDIVTYADGLPATRPDYPLLLKVAEVLGVQPPLWLTEGEEVPL